jgi:hypothetical protein
MVIRTSASECRCADASARAAGFAAPATLFAAGRARPGHRGVCTVTSATDEDARPDCGVRPGMNGTHTTSAMGGSTIGVPPAQIA